MFRQYLPIKSSNPKIIAKNLQKRKVVSKAVHNKESMSTFSALKISTLVSI